MSKGKLLPNRDEARALGRKPVVFLKEHRGMAEDEDNRDAYEISINVKTGAPIVKSELTKRYFTLSWFDIIKMAIEAGIDDSDHDFGEKEDG